MIIVCHGVCRMTDWMPFEEEEYGLLRKTHRVNFMQDELSEAINASVKQSICRALEDSVPQQINQASRIALKPIMQQLELFAKHQGCVPAQDPVTGREIPPNRIRRKPNHVPSLMRTPWRP
ncbi:hypothetical protein NDU88_000114 [Pleurodeles waltl]|uniref:Uncharacterized protein n=1 Tax=Pleurodeles waltl TaxID=8319 RepID=A0AAV7KN60_PLEWA|nr:hypothetical protein NDU88_000114 [Pleurodeles waltl]